MPHIITADNGILTRDMNDVRTTIFKGFYTKFRTELEF